jgi:hypothetical protein
VAISIPFVSGLVGGLLLLLTACQPKLLLPKYEAADNSQLPPLPAYPGFSPISFCQLPAFPRQLVYVRGLYTTDNREYSDFESLRDSSFMTAPCREIELTLPSAYQLPPLLRAKFDALGQDDYSTQYLVVDAIGQYDQDNPEGYGNLEYYKGRFVVRELVQVTHVVVKKRKGHRILLID